MLICFSEGANLFIIVNIYYNYEIYRILIYINEIVESLLICIGEVVDSDYLYKERSIRMLGA